MKSCPKARIETGLKNGGRRRAWNKPRALPNPVSRKNNSAFPSYKLHTVSNCSNAKLAHYILHHDILHHALRGRKNKQARRRQAQSLVLPGWVLSWFRLSLCLPRSLPVTMIGDVALRADNGSR
jgi:hypothetical protein